MCGCFGFIVRYDMLFYALNKCLFFTFWYGSRCLSLRHCLVVRNSYYNNTTWNKNRTKFVHGMFLLLHVKSNRHCGQVSSFGSEDASCERSSLVRCHVHSHERGHVLL